MVAGENSAEELRRRHEVLKSPSIKSRMEGVDSILPPDLLQSVNQLREKGASSWLTAVPPVGQGKKKKKQQQQQQQQKTTKNNKKQKTRIQGVCPFKV